MVEESVVPQVIEGKPRSYTKLIIFLLIVVLGLLYLYYILGQPLLPLVSPRLKGYTHVLSIYGAGADRLYRPTEVAVGKTGNIYVADTFKHRILVFDGNGKLLTKFGKKGKGKGEIEFPSAVTVDDAGRIYVTSYTLNKLVIYNQRYRPYWEITFPGIGPLTATVKDKKLYVATRSRIMIGDLKGNLLTTLGKGGSRKGEVNRPTGIVVDNAGNIYLADSMNYRIEALTKNGKPLWVVGASPTRIPGQPMQERERTRQFGLPTSLTIGADGNLYVMDAFNGEINILDTKGKILGKVGDWGREDGQFYYPAGIASAGGDRFVIADKFNDRVQIVRIPSPTAGGVLPFAPYAISILPLLLLLLLALLLLIRRRRLIVAEPEFLDWAIKNNALAMLRGKFRVVRVAEEVYETYKDLVQDHVALADLLEVGKYDEKVAKKVTEDYDTDAVSAKTLAICKKHRTRHILLVDSPALREIATQLNISVLNHEEFMAVYGESAPQEEPA